MTNYYSYSEIKNDHRTYEEIAKSIQDSLSPEDAKIEYDKLLASWYKLANKNLDGLLNWKILKLRIIIF